MSDKQTPKTFEEWLSGKLEIAPSKQDRQNLYDMKDVIELGWNERAKSVSEEINAATEATRTEYDDKIKAMQAEIDKRDKLTKEREVRMTEQLAYVMAILKTLNDSTEWTDKQKQVLQGFKEGETLLNQRGEDE